MMLYRIASRTHIRDMSGTGSMLFGGRWNMKGVRMLYTSQSVSLAMLEVLANLSSPHISRNLHLAEIHFPDHLAIQECDLPDHWSSFPFSQGTISLGTDFIKSGGLCLKVPSALVPSEYNYLLNPLHADFDAVKILDTRPVVIDQRLVP